MWGKLLDIPELQCPHLYDGHSSALAVLLKELNKMNVNQGAPGDLALGFWAFTAMTQVQFLVGALTSRKPKKKKKSMNHRTGDGSLGWEGVMAGAGSLQPPPWEHQRRGRVCTKVWAPSMQVVKQGFQAADTGVGQQRVLLQKNNKPTDVHVIFHY